MTAFKVNALPSLMVFCFICRLTSCTIVTIEGGQLEGVYEDGITKFLGIPYAEPPLNGLRFKKPVPKKPWTPDVLNCTQYGHRCPQLRSNPLPMSEDCLTLNIFVPGNMSKTMSSRAVMVWVHGGGYRHGTSSDYNPASLAVHGDVIIVTMNYRLNSFGFLTTGDAQAKGNYGLWDQHLSFSWVKSNIGEFGGDVNRITIFGASAGGFSVGIHAISPINSGLFHRVIAHSGTSLSPRATKAPQHALNMTYWFAGELNCSKTGSNHTALLDCLRTKTSDDLVGAYRVINRQLYGSFVPHWAPVVDGDFIAQSPAQLLSNKSSEAFQFFSNLDFTAGSNSGEGGIYYFSSSRGKAFGYDYKDGMTQDVLVNNVAPAVAEAISTNVYSDVTNMEKFVPAIADMYSSSLLNMTQQALLSIDFLTDAMFFSCTVRQVDAHASSSARKSRYSYIYYFDYVPHYRVYKPATGYPSWFHKTDHTEERPFVFGLENYYPKSFVISEDERRLSEAMMTYWTNFGKTGDPNSPKSVNITWAKVTPSARMFMVFNNASTVTSNMLKGRSDFWSYTLPQLLARQAHEKTTPPISEASQLTINWALLFFSLWYFKVTGSLRV